MTNSTINEIDIQPTFNTVALVSTFMIFPSRLDSRFEANTMPASIRPLFIDELFHIKKNAEGNKTYDKNMNRGAGRMARK